MTKFLVLSLACAFACACARVVHVKETPVESARVHEHFRVLDANGDGVIDEAELSAYAKTVQTDPGAPSYEKTLASLEAELAKADVKHDGKITEAAYDRYEEPLEK